MKVIKHGPKHKSSHLVTPASTKARDVGFRGSRNSRDGLTSHQALDKAWPKKVSKNQRDSDD